MLFDTIIAPITAVGSGAVSTLRISGPECFNAVDAVVSFKKGSASEAKGYSLKFGTIEGLDEVLVAIFRNPHSYTGEDSAEISCHASSYIVSKLLERFIAAGCRMAEPGEFTKRAFINGKMDLTQAEAVADVIASTSEAAHRIAMNQLKGGFSNELSSLRDRLLEMASLMELELDFSEEDVEFADRSRLNALLDAVVAKIDSLAGSFALGNAIKNGIPVAIVGATNAGKSTLLNTILGEQRAIVSNIAGTTRDTIEECFNVDGVLFRFIDTAGIRNLGADEIEKIGIERSFESIKKARIILAVIDAEAILKAGIDDSLKALESVDFGSQRVICCLNKVDNISVTEINKIVSLVKNKIFAVFNESNALRSHIDASESGIPASGNDIPLIPISAKENIGVKELLSDLAHKEKERINAIGSDSVMITNYRHWEALTTARRHLDTVRQGLLSGLPTDLVASDLRLALDTLGSITGQISSQDVLNNIFRNYCIGK